MQKGLISLRRSHGGVSFLLSKQLRTLEWLVLGLEVRDDFGRCFHVVEAPIKTVRDVLETSWLQCGTS